MDKKKIKEKINEQKSQFKHKKHLVKPIFVVTLLILLQIVLFIYLSNKFSKRNDLVDSFWMVLRFILIIYILNLDQAIDYRVAWIIPIAAFPVFGIVLYLLLDILPGAKQLKERLLKIKSKNMPYLKQDKKTYDEVHENVLIDNGLEKYLYEIAGYPIYQNTKLDYYSSGEEYFENLLKDLKKAEEFIFMEFFIIKEGYMLNSILDILEEKACEGVEIRFMYDGMNDYHLPSDYYQYLQSRGIDVSVFAPVRPILSTYHNNRDHRKIVSIDNKIAYTGGINLADEYINKIERFGHWKDNGIRLEGEAVKNFTLMFLNLWDLSDASKYDLDKYLKNIHTCPNSAYVQPFDDSPNDAETVGENAYVDVLNQAKDYVYIMTPYLILSEKIKEAIIFASKRGVDVRIMMPGIPDKKIPYNMGRSYYEYLIKNGVKIFEYSLGFQHSKAIVSDDQASIVGTINLDFRSLHLHYENAVLVYDEKFALEVKEDFLKTQKISLEITMERYKNLNFFYRLSGKVLKIIAPLM